MIRVAAIGECMLELTHRDEQTLALGYGGDTLNTALYLARTSARSEIAVDYLTAVGDDTNYRPALWPDLVAARTVFTEFLSVISLALPTFEDEEALWGDGDSETTARRYAAAGVPEVAVKRGARGCTLCSGGRLVDVPVAQSVKAVDTTAAGDGFNAGYLAARLTGASPEQA